MYLTELLKEQLNDTTFVKKGKAFFRVWGEGVLQVIKFEYEPHMAYRVLSVGFQSMYGNLRKQLFSSSGCITGYGVSLIRSMAEGRTERIPPLFLTAEEQLCLLKDYALPFLDTIKTQSDLGKAYCALDNTESGSVIWNCTRKMDAFLAAGEYALADKVVSSILRQHLPSRDEAGRLLENEDYWALPWNESNYSEYEKKYHREEDDDFLKIHHWIASEDYDSIQKYLRDNYEQNCQYAKFCLSRKRIFDSNKNSQRFFERLAKAKDIFQKKERIDLSIYRSLNLMSSLDIQESNHLREKYIFAFVDMESKYYRDKIETLTEFSDGMCYIGYLWDCLKNSVVVSKAELNEKLKQKRNIFIMWDIHSQDNIFTPNYWKYPKECVLATETWSESMLKNLPEDIYIFDETFTWSAVYTHEIDQSNAQYCLYIERT